MGSYNHSSGQLRVLSAIVAGNVLEVLIDHPLDEEIQPEPEDFTLQLDDDDAGDPATIEIKRVVLSAGADNRSYLRFDIADSNPLTGHLLLTYQPKHCFMYSLATEDSIDCFDGRVALQLQSVETLQPESPQEPSDHTVEQRGSDNSTQRELFASVEDSTPDDNRWMKTAGAYIAEANEHHIDILFSQPVESPQPIRNRDFKVWLNGVEATLSRSYLHTSLHRQEPCIRLDLKEAVQRDTSVVVSYSASHGGISLADGALVPHFHIQLEADWVGAATSSAKPEPSSGAGYEKEAGSEEVKFSFVKNLFTPKPGGEVFLTGKHIGIGVALLVCIVVIAGVFVLRSETTSVKNKPVADVAKQTANNAASDTVTSNTENNTQLLTQQRTESQQVAASASNEPVKNCKLTYPKGDKYVGQCNANNRPHGQGQYNWVSGSVYTGQWLDGKREGFGTIDYSNGDRYQGNWVANKKQGQGTYWSENGSRYEGEFQAGQFTANGICYMPNGSRITGPCPAAANAN